MIVRYLLKANWPQIADNSREWAVNDQGICFLTEKIDSLTTTGPVQTTVRPDDGQTTDPTRSGDSTVTVCECCLKRADENCECKRGERPENDFSIHSELCRSRHSIVARRYESHQFERSSTPNSTGCRSSVDQV